MDTPPWKKHRTDGEDELLKCSQVYVVMWLNPDWLHQADVLAVNGYGQISFNYGDWHGKAKYEWCPIIGGTWNMDYITPWCPRELTSHRYVQVRGALVYLHSEQGVNSKYNSNLFPSPDAEIKTWNSMRQAWLDQVAIKAYNAHSNRVGPDPWPS